MNKDTILTKLQELREEYRNAPDDKKFSVQMKARAWQSALFELELKEKRYVHP